MNHIKTGKNNDICLVNVATNKSDESKGIDFVPRQKLLVESVIKFHPTDIDILLYTGEFPEGSPTWKQIPQAFKSHALLCAKNLGYRILIWADTSIRFRKPIYPLIDVITHLGHYYQLNPNYNSGGWLSDAALKTLNITREESFYYPQLLAGIFGLNMDFERSRRHLNEMFKFANDGITYIGPRFSKPGEISSNRRVRGVREQSCLSILSIRSGMAWRIERRFFVNADDHYGNISDYALGSIYRGL